MAGDVLLEMELAGSMELPDVEPTLRIDIRTAPHAVLTIISLRKWVEGFGGLDFEMSVEKARELHALLGLAIAKASATGEALDQAILSRAATSIGFGE